MFQFVTVLIMSVLLCSCSAHRQMPVSPFSCSPDIALSGAAGVDQNGMPVFAPTDTQAAARLLCSNVTGSHSLRWEWYANNLPYLITRDIRFGASENNFREKVAASHALNIRGERAAELAGAWNVRVYLDDAVLGEKRFAVSGIQSGGPIQAASSGMAPAAAQTPAVTALSAAVTARWSTPSKIIQIIKAPNNMMYVRTADADGELWLGLVDTPFNRVTVRTGDLVSYKSARIKRNHKAADLDRSFSRFAVLHSGVLINGTPLYND